MNYFTYNGTSSASMGIRIQTKNVYSAPKYDTSSLAVPGRDGDLIVQGGRFPNVSVSYTCFVPAKNIQELADKLTAIKGWLYAEPNKYHSLTDTYDTRFIRRAVFNNKLDITEQCMKIGIFTITFSCYPFRFSVAGQQKSTYTGTFSVSNPYRFNSKPYLKVNGTGSGTLTIQASGHNKTWNFSNINGYTEVDSEQMNFYHDTTLKNDTVSGDGFPELYPGENIVSFTGGIQSVEIIPRWRTL